MSLKPQVALAQDFLLQLSKLPSNVQARVMKWAVLFQSDPTAGGINYEKIKAARDTNLRSVRIDQDWRGIVFKPDRGDVYVLLYVDHHDDAYRWAEHRKLAVNPVTGAMQLVVLEQVTETVTNEPKIQFPAEISKPAKALEPVPAPLFAGLTDHDLLSLGLPEDLIASVRVITVEAQLDAMQAQLPIEAYEGLFLVAAGDSVDQVLASRETRVDSPIDTEDFATALATPEARSRFVLVEDDEAMRTILNAPLAQWRVFLHPTQQKLAVGDRSGPVRVLGGAGTGKTVLAMHRAKWLAEHRTRDNQKVLFTTFTRNLATDIEQNLQTLCSSTTLARIEVRNLDAWVNGYLRSQKLEHRIVYDRKLDPAQQAWRSALASRDTSLDLSDDFYEQELEQVILAQGITTRDAYRLARRTGRNGVLSRSKRDAVWPVFEEYRGQLASRRLKEVDDAYREVAELLERQSGNVGYSAIVVDETQDFGPQALKLLRAMIPRGPNDLLFVGDGHQRIYSRNRAAMSKCGIDIRGRSRKLYLNYRTTDEIRRQAVALLEGCEVDDLDDGHDESRKYKSLSRGPSPDDVTAAGIDEAALRAATFIRSLREEVSGSDRASPTVCVIASSEAHRDAVARRLEADGLRTVAITAQSNQTDADDVIRVATMHRAKGLEFDAVVVLAPASFFGDVEQTAAKRRLLYVALTRAKRYAMLIRMS